MNKKDKFPECVRITDLKTFKYHLEITHHVDDYIFQTKVFYPDVDLFELNKNLGNKLMNKIYAHIALCETFKYCSLFPRKIDFSRISSYLNVESLDFFLHTFKNAYSQCSYENEIDNSYEPILIYGDFLEDSSPITLTNYFNETILVGNGGGKDSFLAMKILDQANLSYSAYQWTRPEYGKSQYQHNLCAKLLKYTAPIKSHHVSVFDDFTEGPFIKLYYSHLKGSFTLGIPECIFEALPVMLQNRYNALCFANERSSDTGNLYWEGLQGVVNHQWVKSLEAELYFQDFIEKFLVKDFRFFSILKPIYDYKIFGYLSLFPEFIKSSHSCNIDKPWCKKCAKCAYVWLGYLAHFEKSLVDEIFGINPFDDEDLLVHYKNMTGIEGHRSFECIGNIEECQLFMKKCIDKGLQGKMLDIFKQKIIKSEEGWKSIESKFNGFHTIHNIPDAFLEKIETSFIQYKLLKSKNHN